MSECKHNPSRAEIRRVCAEIRDRWDPAERMRRLRPDWRPIAWALAAVEVESIPPEDAAPGVVG